VVATGRVPKPPALGEVGPVADPTSAHTSTRPVHWGDGFVDTAIYDGTRLGAGATIDGPALVEEPFTVVAVPPDVRLRLGDDASYELTAIPR
jgi:N-methylhydantoinase A